MGGDARSDKKVIKTEIFLYEFPIGHTMDGNELKLHRVADNFFVKIKKFLITISPKMKK